MTDWITASSDFAIFWEIGKAILQGLSPYSVAQSWYPPAVSYFFVLFALGPVPLTIWIWRTLLIVLLAIVARREGWWSVLYLPLPFVVLAGQMDLVFVALVPYLARKGWEAPVAAALITLKPIIAVIVLPWYAIRWFLRDRGLLGRFVVISLAVHSWPLLLRPTVWSEWIEIVFGSAPRHYFGGVGIWLLDGLPAWLMILWTASLCIAALYNSERVARSLLLLASPFSAPYHSALLVGSAPGWFLAANSILTVTLYAVGGDHLWLIALPGGPLAFQIVAALRRRAKRRNSLTIPAPESRIRRKVEVT